MFTKKKRAPSRFSYNSRMGFSISLVGFTRICRLFHLPSQESSTQLWFGTKPSFTNPTISSAIGQSQNPPADQRTKWWLNQTLAWTGNTMASRTLLFSVRIAPINQWFNELFFFSVCKHRKNDFSFLCVEVDQKSSFSSLCVQKRTRILEPPTTDSLWLCLSSSAWAINSRTQVVEFKSKWWLPLHVT